MPSRRDVLKLAGAVGVAAATSIQIGCSTKQYLARSPAVDASGARTAGVRIRSATLHDDTILRLGGNGDNWHMSWAADDRQYVSLCDGFGWPGLKGYDMKGEEFNTRLYTISGGPREAVFGDVSGYPWLVRAPDAKQPRYYGFGTLALDGHLYQFLSTLNRADKEPDGTGLPSPRFCGAKLIYSPDHGRSWFNQNGTTPVRWEDWAQRSRETMVFFEEDQGSFAFQSVLQMGRNNEHNRDGYVYVYSPNGTVDGMMNELVMFRVPKDRILDRGAYEYFAGLDARGDANWTRGILARGIVHRFPRGWVGAGHSYGWIPSLAYNAPLGLYMMTNWGMGTNAASEWFVKPSYLGFWVARNPWGPWTQIYEDTAWTPAGDPKARAYNPQIAPKWISQDGRSFWIVWTDFQVRRPFPEQFTVDAKTQHMPYYAFNVQRVDLDVA